MLTNKRFLVTITTVLLTCCLLVVGTWLLLNRTVDRVVEKEAEASAISWVDYFRSRLGNVESLITTGTPDEEQSLTIDSAVEFGEVFRFKLFRPNGTIAMVSDEYKFKQEGSSLTDVNTKALNVFKTGNSFIVTGDGRQKDNRPDIYVEAYVPITNSLGERIGVVEVYVDQTEMAASLVGGFSWTLLFLPAFCALLYLVPTLALLRKRATSRIAITKAKNIANFDALTGLHNRRSFKNSAGPYFSKHRTIGTLFIDIDDFKQINDEYSHEGGDAFLCSVGLALKNEFGDNAIFARFGGDEFVACIGDITPEELETVAQGVLASVSKGVSHKGSTIIGHVSIGLNVDSSDKPLSDMLHAADTALYKSKDKGKNTITLFSDELSKESERQRKLEKLLRSAVDGTGLELYFQPINQPDSNKILGFESLLRLKDEEGTIILPDEFIPMAERLGVIEEIGKWVFCQAVSSAKKWPNNIFVSVNLSNVQFKSGDLVSFLKGLLLEHNFPASRLEIEVTESLVVGDDASTQKQLAEIKSWGVSIAMDNFGVGYSSLEYLWKHDFDRLKIDRSFLMGYKQDPEKLKKLIESVVEMGHDTNMYVTVEGVENEAHIEILKGMGCDQLQGYYFGKPMCITDVEALISAEYPEYINSTNNSMKAS